MRIDSNRPKRRLTAEVHVVIINSLDGAVAQLGERMTGSHEVRGSIPLSSTIVFNNLRPFYP